MGDVILYATSQCMANWQHCNTAKLSSGHFGSTAKSDRHLGKFGNNTKVHPEASWSWSTV